MPDRRAVPGPDEESTGTPPDTAAEPAGTPDAGLPGARDEPVHDPSGLDLARQIAASVSAARVRQRRRTARREQPQVSSARPDDRDPAPLGTALGRLMASRGWEQQVNVHVVLGRWPAMVGPTLAEHCTPEAYDDGVLTVRASSTTWATQVRHLAPRIVARLNEELGDQSVLRIDVRGPQAPSWKHGRRTVEGRGPRDTYG